MIVPLLLALAAADTTGIGAALRAATHSAPPLWMRWRGLADVRPAMETGYGARGWAPFWLDGNGQPTPNARVMVRELGSLHDKGLDPRDYDAAALAMRLDSLATPAQMAAWDATLSVAAMRAARALDRGRVNPTALHATLRLRREPFDGTAILASLAGAANPAAALRDLEPTFYQYRRLVAILHRYRVLSRDSTLLPLPAGPRVLHPDSAWAGVGSLRRLLVVLGDHAPIGAGRANDTVYEAGAVEAVRRFQRRHGLTDDGIIGPGTRRWLDRPWQTQIRQIELTLERWRWLPRDEGVPPLIVNIPAFRLYATRGFPALESETLAMDVVVGTAVTHDTPLLTAELEAVDFQPYWNVPASIATAEILPKALADSTYLTTGGYELMQGNRVVATTPERLAELGKSIWVRQRPGPANALGRVKFVTPNPESIFLHDTPSRALFGQQRRDFSHGCIRVVDPAALAAWALRELPEWTRARIDSAMAGTERLVVTLPRKIPVYLVYQSVVVRESGETLFHADVYGHDATLDAALRKGYPYAGTSSGRGR